MTNKPVKNIIIGLVVFAISYTLVGNFLKSRKNQPQDVADKVSEYMTNEEWPEFNSTVASFKVNFPKYPQTDSNTITASGVDIQYTQYSAVDEEGDTYMIQYNVYTNVDPGQLDTQKALEGSVNGSVASSAGNVLVDSSLTTFSQLPAVKYQIKNDEANTYMTGINFLSGNQLYTLLVASKTESPLNYNKFIDSFSLTK